jgi:hypothetical protein
LEPDVKFTYTSHRVLDGYKEAKEEKNVFLYYLFFFPSRKEKRDRMKANPQLS